MQCPELNESQHSQACAEEEVATATGTVLQLNRRAASEFNFIELQFQRVLSQRLSLQTQSESRVTLALLILFKFTINNEKNFNNLYIL